MLIYMQGYGRLTGVKKLKRTFKDKAVMKAAQIKKNNKSLTPIVILGLCLILGIYSVLKHISVNGKRYITLGMVFLFFFMSSSFATPDQVMDSEVYLSNVDMASVDSYDVSKENNYFSENTVEYIDYDDVDGISILSYEEEKALESTENIDTFTLVDFYSDIVLSDNNSVSNSEFDKESWNLILVNKTHPVPEGYEVPLTTIKGSMKCDERVLEPLVEMLNAADKSGINLVVCSPYRDYKLQEKLFLRKVNAYMNNGYSYLEAYKKSSTDVLVPGASEHQLGIAFDIVVDYHAVLDEAFGNTEGGMWLRDHACEYGFILRYPKGKEYITGIEYEPWHFRYVGKEAAEYIYKKGVTLEEFLDTF